LTNPADIHDLLTRYLLGTEHALKFLRGGWALSSVLSRNDKLRSMFLDRFGEIFQTVGQYYAVHAEAVRIEDVSPWLSELAEELIAEADAEPNDYDADAGG